MKEIDAFPLTWPEGWPRHRGTREWGQFKGTPGAIREELIAEIDRLVLGNDARDHTVRDFIIISSNLPLRRDGMPIANAREPQHGGVAWGATDHQKAFKWKPSIYMPRWVSRILLEITAVRVERLQDISEEDAEAEGVQPMIETGPLPDWQHTSPPGTRQVRHIDHVTPYRTLWESINGPGSWDANPFLWAITFNRITP